MSGGLGFLLRTNITGGNVTPRRLKTVLKQAREAADLTQEELASRAGVGQPYIALLEAGKKKNPSLAVLKRLAKVLDVPITELLG
jgi:transcriptional regulator with XRE-family HTH domain